MKDFIYLIHPLRQGFFNDPTPSERKIMDEHFEYLKNGAKRGSVLLAGPCTDDTFGLVIFQAEDEASADTFMMNDPSVKQNVMVAELHPMRISIHE